MDIAKARRLASRQRQNIGRLLTGLKKMKVSFKDGPGATKTFEGGWNETIDLLRANMRDLRRLYQQYPQIKPIRTKQLSLFK